MYRLVMKTIPVLASLKANAESLQSSLDVMIAAFAGIGGEDRQQSAARDGQYIRYFTSTDSVVK